MEDVSLIKLLFCLAVLGIVYSISNNSINPLVGLVLIIVAGIAEQKMEAMIVGKERTSLKIENAYISDEMMWWYEHKKLLYVGLILLHLYCVYTYLFKWYDYEYVGITLLTIGVDVSLIYFIIRKRMGKK